MKVLLINPSKYDEEGQLVRYQYGTTFPTNLLILASIVREFPDVEVKVVDEYIHAVPFNEDFDWVGITTLFSCTFPRVADISRRFRERDIPVVLGGTHATCNYSEPPDFADSIVIGEAENTLHELMNDLLQGRGLRRVYKDNTVVDMEKVPLRIPAYDLVDRKKYFRLGLFRKSNIFQLETSRGCPMRCSYCCVRLTHGTKLRYRPIEHIVTEIQFLKDKYQASLFTFTDDNFLFDVERSRDLLTALTEQNIHFACQLSPRIIIDHLELIPLLKKAGCVSALLGIESINDDSLRSVKKNQNKVDEYQRLFSLFSNNRIPVMPLFMIGFDHDSGAVFDELLNFLRSVRAQRAMFSIVTPFPGTELYDMLAREGRIAKDDLSLYDFSHVVFHPKLMSLDELQEEFWNVYRKYYRLSEIMMRVMYVDRRLIAHTLVSNLRFRKQTYKRLFPYNSGINRIPAEMGTEY